MCGGSYYVPASKPTPRAKAPYIYHRQIDNHVSFYAPYGDDKCTHGTKWCKKHCYLKSVPFTKDEEKKIQSAKIEDIGLEIYKVYKELKKIKYFTFFASGCIENLGKNKNYTPAKYMDRMIEQSDEDQKFRFFIRSIEGMIVDSHKKAVTILAIDVSSPKNMLTDAIQRKVINAISIVNHKDNLKLINLLKGNELLLRIYGITKIIDCEDCKDDMLCFKQNERFILIQKYKPTRL